MSFFSKNLRAIFMVLGAFAVFNIADAFMKHLTDIYSIAAAGLYVNLMYITFVMSASRKLGGLKAIYQTKKLKLHFLRAGFGTACFLLFLYALTQLTLAQIYVLILTSPFWIALMAVPIFKETIGFHRWVSIIIGFIGVLVVMRPGFQEMSFALIAPVLAAIAFGGVIMVTRKIGEDEPLSAMVFYPAMLDIIVFILILIFFGGWKAPEINHLWLFAAGGLTYLLGVYYSSKGFASADSTLLAPLHYTQIVWGTLIGYFFFEEVPDRWTIVGALIIVGSGLHLIYREHLAHQKENRGH